MKKSLVMLLMIPVLAYAQPDSSSFILHFSGGYADLGTSNGVSSLGSVISNANNWNVGLTVGLPIGKKWAAGIGFEYLKQKNTTLSEIYIPKEWYAIQETETKINLIIGKVYLAGYWRLVNNLYFNPIFSSNVGKANSAQVSMKFVTKDYSSLPNEFVLIEIENPILIGEKEDISYNYFALSFAPAFSFYFTRNFALNLETGNFQFSATDWKWDNKQWLANINPTYWRLGIIVAF